MNERPVRRIGIWLLVAFSFAASGLFVVWRLAGPSDGAPIPFYAGAWQAEGVVISAASQSGALRAGDVVIALEGESLSALIDETLAAVRSPTAHTTTVTYTVQRSATVVDIPVPLLGIDASSTLGENWANILFGTTLLAVALYVLWRRPEASASVALAVAATAAGASITPWLLGLAVSDIYFGWPFLLQSIAVNGIYMLLWPAGAVHLPLTISVSGQGLTNPPRRTLALAYGLPLGAYAVLLLFARLASPTTTAWFGTWPTVQGLVIVPTVAAGLVLAVRTYRAASRDARRQIRWALIGGAFATVVGLALLFLPQLVTGRPLIPWSVVGLVGLPLPIGIAIAITRHRLWDIEVAVNRTLVYGGLTLAIVAIYATTVLVLGLLPAGAGFPFSVLATGLAAIVALPIRDRLQRGVNRLMYGDRDEPYRAIARLAQRLESTIEPLAIPSAIVESVAEALRLPYVALEIGPPGAVEFTASRGAPVAKTSEIALIYGAETVGRLLLAPRSPGETFSPGDERLLDDLARGAGAAVNSVRLTLDIVRARERLVAAREEERRRIRRDLHDGLGPTLAGIGMRAELAADLAGRDPAAAEQTLTELTGEVRGALAEIRRLVDGLRPPSLDERGLIGAIQAQAEHLGPKPAFSVMAAAALPELPAAIEVAAYRICVEAMTNAARHADARECRVTLVVSDDTPPALRVEVTDDGRGMDRDAHPGVGLASMRERATEVGGSIDFGRRTGGGTTITARLPIHLPARR